MHRLALCVSLILSIIFALSLTTAEAQVSIPASVIDASGRSLHGLQIPDFEVSCGKKAGFDSVEEIPALKFTALSDPTPVFILFDALSIPPLVQNQTAKQLLTYLRKAADERLAVTLLVNSGRGLEVIHDVSTDEQVFVAALDRVMPEKKRTQADSASGTSSDEFAKSVAQEARQLQELTKTLPYASSYKTTMHERLSSAEEDDARLGKTRTRKFASGRRAVPALAKT